jgi:glutamine---fructose-6-phosphate transaminase (isomerizing)
MIAEQTQMFAEAGQGGAVAARQLAANATLMQTIGARLRAADPPVIFTCGRGSSDHAATFAKYLFETRLRIATVSQAPSLASLSAAPLRHMQGAPFIVISQSGRSPDLLLSAQAARDAGALVIALVNDTASPLAEIADSVVPLHAGPETSVAATKSFIASLVAIVHLTAAWCNDAALLRALGGLGAVLEAAWTKDCAADEAMVLNAPSLFVLGRQLTLGIAQEAALKFKETSGIHAEAFSIAEVAHGPMALVTTGFPLLVFPPAPAARAGMADLLEQLGARGARIVMADGPHAGMHPALAPIAMIQSFYHMVNAIAVNRGYDPDHPPLLNKVTKTR